MIDQLGRDINYARISITDRCNFSCSYCKTGQENFSEHLLSQQEIITAVNVMMELGIHSFKITGGEPLLREDCCEIIKKIKNLGANVTITTNGSRLKSEFEHLLNAGVDGINVSLDTLNSTQFSALTQSNTPLEQILEGIYLSALHIPTKINAVLLPETVNQWIPLAELATNPALTVRFIQQMPMGYEVRKNEIDIIPFFRKKWSDLVQSEDKLGNGPAVYYKTSGLKGNLGFILAVDEKFCSDCNRIRLSCQGYLQSCLCYENGGDLKGLLQKTSDQKKLKAQMEKIIFEKPIAHCFETGCGKRRKMQEIGG